MSAKLIYLGTATAITYKNTRTSSQKKKEDECNRLLRGKLLMSDELLVEFMFEYYSGRGSYRLMGKISEKNSCKAFTIKKNLKNSLHLWSLRKNNLALTMQFFHPPPQRSNGPPLVNLVTNFRSTKSNNKTSVLRTSCSQRDVNFEAGRVRY